MLVSVVGDADLKLHVGFFFFFVWFFGGGVVCLFTSVNRNPSVA